MIKTQLENMAEIKLNLFPLDPNPEQLAVTFATGATDNSKVFWQR